MNPLVLMLLTFGAVVAAVAAAYSLAADLFLRDRARIGQRIDEEFRGKQRQRARESLLFKDLHQLAFDAAEEESSPGLRRRLEALIEQSGLDLTVRRFGLLTLAAAVLAGTLFGLVRQNAPVGAIGGLLGAVIPLGYVHLKRKARLDKLQGQLPDAFDLMSRVIRAGQTVSQALLAVVDEFAQPIAGEFSLCYEQQNLGLSPELALRDLAQRTGLLEIKIFVTALLVQQQTGGNLAGLLDKLADIIRQRQRIRGQIQTLTAEGRLQAVVLLTLPIAVFFAMLLLNHDYAVELLAHPSLIATTLVSEGLGAIWIRSIVNFEF
jgi:tight adherence protein B